MKLFSTYIKEMKIAARGFYFYIEIGMAVIILLVLLLAVNENPTNRSEEYLYFDMPKQMLEQYFAEDISAGSMVFEEPVELKLKAVSFEVRNEETGEISSYDFDEKTIMLDVFKTYDKTTGEVTGTIYMPDNEEDLMRLAYSEKKMAAKLSFSDEGKMAYTYYNQGYETERFTNLLYVLNLESLDTLAETAETQEIRKLGEVELLNNRENLIPPFIVFTGSLMGFFIVMAYIFLDKSEGVIRAFAVTPSSVWKYLLSKTFVIMTTVLISASIITIPIMGGQPHYLLFYLFLLATTFAFAALGLLISSFYNNISKAFGALYSVMVILIIPAFSYFIPSFDPIWLRIFPTYSMLHGFKEVIMVDGNIGYTLMFTGVYMAGGLILFILANLKFKKTLTV